MKETTVVVLTTTIGATVLAGMGVIGATEWAVVAGIGTGGKAVQGTADRWNGRRKPPNA
jgi:hypothetical protein